MTRDLPKGTPCEGEARTVAELMVDQNTKRIMLNIASGYDVLAEQAANGMLRWKATDET